MYRYSSRKQFLIKRVIERQKRLYILKSNSLLFSTIKLLSEKVLAFFGGKKWVYACPKIYYYASLTVSWYDWNMTCIFFQNFGRDKTCVFNTKAEGEAKDTRVNKKPTYGIKLRTMSWIENYCENGDKGRKEAFSPNLKYSSFNPDLAISQPDKTVYHLLRR